MKENNYSLLAIRYSPLYTRVISNCAFWPVP
jgi:hypothetical protein